MSVSVEPVLDVEESGEHIGHSDAQYIKIAAILAGLTAIEVALPLIFEGSGKIYGPALVILMGIKFFMVASFFMHLRFDNILLSRVFYAGLLLAASVRLLPSAALSAAPSVLRTPRNGMVRANGSPVSGFDVTLPSKGG